MARRYGDLYQVGCSPRVGQGHVATCMTEAEDPCTDPSIKGAIGGRRSPHTYIPLQNTAFEHVTSTPIPGFGQMEAYTLTGKLLNGPVRIHVEGEKYSVLLQYDELD
jgi:hypothetical protein